MQLDKVAKFSSANDFLACKAVARSTWIDTAKDKADSPHENKWPMTMTLGKLCNLGEGFPGKK